MLVVELHTRQKPCPRSSSAGLPGESEDEPLVDEPQAGDLAQLVQLAELDSIPSTAEIGAWWYSL